MIGYNNSAPKAVNNVGQFGATEGSIGAYKSAAEYAADAKYWALLSQTKYSSIEEILAEVERLYAQGRLLKEDIEQLKTDFETQQQDLLGLIQSTGTAIDNTNAATELSKEATQQVLAQLDIISNMAVQTTLLPPGSMATGSYDNSTGVFSFGIPEGQPGRDGTDGTISDIGSVPVGTPVTDDYGFYVDKVDGGLYRADMSDIANLVPSVRSISINGGAEQMGAVVFNSVSSFNTRTGDVVSQVGDYEVGQITGAAASGDNSDITSLSGLTTALSVSQGGTGATTPEDSRTNLGLGSVSVEDIVPLIKGGTGATTPSAARTNLGLGLVSTESIVPITKGGTGSTSAENARLALVAAKSGANSDITSMTNSVTFTQPVSVADATNAVHAVNLGQISSEQGAHLIGTANGASVQDTISDIESDLIKLKLNWAIENGYSDSGFTFTTGGTLSSNDQDKVVYDPVSKTWYSYKGVLPVTIPAGLNPTSGSDWEPEIDPTLREDLAGPDGVTLVGGAASLGFVSESFNSYSQDDVSKNRFNFTFGNRYSISFNNNLRQQLQTYVENVFNFAPKTVALPSGRLVTIYTVKEGTNTDPGQNTTPMHIDFMISDDNGVNWTKTGTVVNKGAGYATSETILFLNNKDGYLYCFYTSMKGLNGWGHAQQGTDPDTTSIIEYCVSKNQGETWSAPVDITSAVKPAGAYFSSIAPTQAGYINGRPAIPYYYLTTKSSGIVEGYITTDKDGNYVYGEDVRKDTDTDTLGTSGGEIGFGNFYDGTPFAIERAADTTLKPHKVAIQKLLVRNASGKWVVKGQFPTTNCMASFLRVGPDFGFDKDYLFVVAPIGATGEFEGRANLRLFDCTDDFNNPQDKGLLSDSTNVETGYSSTVLLSSGVMMSVWNGRQWTINNSLYTVNRLVNSAVIPVPFCGTFKIVNTLRTYGPDIKTNEMVIGLSDGLTYRWSGSAFVRDNPSTTTTINSVVTSLNSNTADIFYLDSGSTGSSITSITGGYVGKRISILPLSGGTEVTLVRQASGVSIPSRIMYKTSTGATQYVTDGELIQLTRTDYGWYLDKSANKA